ncbi:MAG: riboflavin kinase/FMN adenylyltransferase [Saprospiraceae bacterium]|jgi:riboflavin kinase/FMN adenylyltransferase
MKIIRNTADYLPGDNKSVVTIGNFDGLHKGHQRMIALAKEKAEALGANLVVLSFDPLPVEYFLAESAPARLMSFSEKCLGLAELGVDVACIKGFDSRFSNTSADEFVQQTLLNDLKAAHVVVGDDFRYGKGRDGSVNSLKAAAQNLGFQVSQLSTISETNERISSTRLRETLAKGDFENAALLLGRPYSLSARVSYGDQRGRTWGFPTLNLSMRNKRALHGVYAVEVIGLGGKKMQGVANIGVRPTVGGLKHLLEVHVFDYSGEAYGKRVCVEFCQLIRGEQKFVSFDALKTQIGKDCEVAKNHFISIQHE